MKIAIDCGHTLSGADMGCNINRIKEEEKTREIGRSLINLFKKNKYNVIDCTVDYAADINTSLLERVNEANNNNVDCFVSIHLNAFNGTALGVETYIYNYASSKSKEYANSVQRELVKLGYVDRGVKTANFYVLKYTIAPAILIECGFLDNKNDMQLYNPDKIAKAIYIGIVGNIPQENKYDEWVSRLQVECNRQHFSNQIIDGIPGPITLQGCPTLTYGCKGNITKLLQEKLNSMGYNCGAIDGIIGAKTLKAITTFQVNNNLYADGIVGQRTWRKILGL